jgi:hypothetical protein
LFSLDAPINVAKTHVEDEGEMEDYAVWKFRILTEAYAALGKTYKGTS